MTQRLWQLPIKVLICASILFSFQAGNAFADETSDENMYQANPCDFYQNALEKSVPCGQSGYALSYGEKYCNRFKKSESELSPQGQIWSRTTRQCLIDSLTPFTDGSRPVSSCQEIHDVGYSFHSRCYTNEEHSICDLPSSDIEKIISQMDFNDFTSKDGQKQIKQIITTCVTHLEKLETLNESQSSTPSSISSQLSTWKSMANKVSYLQWFYGQN